MKDDNALALAEKAAPQARYCCLAHLRSLLDGVRARHRIGPFVGDSFAYPDEAVEKDAALPSAHDDYCAELDASLFASDQHPRAFTETELRHDDPQELARARHVFAITLIIPMLLISSVLLWSGSELGRPMFSLLQSSLFVLAVPLTASAGAWLIRMLAPGTNSPNGVTHG